MSIEKHNSVNQSEIFRKTISRAKEDPVIKFIIRRKTVFKNSAIMFLILVAAFFMRWNTLWLPHWMGDQSHYISLAMKLDKLGFDHYNLRGIELEFIEIAENSRIRIVYPRLARDIYSKGRILSGLKMAGIDYYDQPLFHKPPVFSVLLFLSNKLFAKSKGIYTVVYSNVGNFIDRLKPKVFMESQFYAVIIPLVFSMGTVLLTFFIGAMLFSNRVGLYGAFIMSIHPVAIMTSQKLWADDGVCFFINIALLCLVIGVKYKKEILFLISGLITGLAVITKQTGGYFAIATVAFLILSGEDRKWKKSDAVIFISSVIFFLAGSAIMINFAENGFSSYFGAARQAAINLRPALLLFCKLILFIFVLRWIGNRKVDIKSLLMALLKRRIFYYVAGVVFVSGVWFIKVYDVFGDPLHLPGQSDLVEKDITGWYTELISRPKGVILFLVGIPYLCPVFAACIGSLKAFVLNIARIVKEKDFDFRFIVLWFTILVFYFFLRQDREHRLMLPVYPSLAILAAYVIDQARLYRGRFAKYLGTSATREAVIVFLLLLCAVWSVPIGVKTGPMMTMLLKKPF